MNEHLRRPVRDVIELLTAGRFKDIEILTNGSRLNAMDIAKAITDYGRQLVMPPEDGYELMDVVEVRDSAPPRWSIRIPLWTREEGRSDLSLELTVSQRSNGFDVELDDIRVL
jgi:hypothetical protein